MWTTRATPFTLSAGDVTGQTLYVKADGSVSAEGPASNANGDGYLGKLTVDNSGAYQFNLYNESADVQTLAEEQTVTVTAALQVSDGHGGTASQDIDFTITGTNDAPTASLPDGGSNVTEAYNEAYGRPVDDSGKISSTVSTHEITKLSATDAEGDMVTFGRAGRGRGPLRHGQRHGGFRQGHIWHLDAQCRRHPQLSGG